MLKQLQFFSEIIITTTRYRHLPEVRLSPKHHSYAPHIATLVVPLADHFWRCGVWRTALGSHWQRVCKAAAEAEVDKLQLCSSVVVVVDEDILKLYVAMCDAQLVDMSHYIHQKDNEMKQSK